MEKKKSTRKKHSLEYKQAAIEKAKKSGNVSATARNLGLNGSLLSTWIRAEKSAKLKGKTLIEAKAENEELAQLRRENQRLKMEAEILKKATAYFSQSELRRGTLG